MGTINCMRKSSAHEFLGCRNRQDAALTEERNQLAWIHVPNLCIPEHAIVDADLRELLRFGMERYDSCLDIESSRLEELFQ